MEITDIRVRRVEADGKLRAYVTVTFDDCFVVHNVKGGNRRAPTPYFRQAFVDHDGLQCGYCTPGQVMAAEGLLRSDPSPSFDSIRRGMSGNLCRCGAYAHIFNAVAAAAENRD